MEKRPTLNTLTDGSVLVTGGRGFLGRHLAIELQNHGFEDIRTVGRAEADLTDQSAVRRLLMSERPRTVIHLAAEVGGIGANQINPGRYFYANAVMGIHLIEESRRAGVEKFVQVGTVCSYPKHTPVPFVEDDLWNGFPEETNAPYGIAKRSLLVMLQAYRAQYGFNGVYLLPANLYGPGDNFDPVTSHVIPALIRKFTDAAHRGRESVALWGTGTASREFLHVSDAARGVTLAVLGYDASEPVNLGTGAEVTIRELALMIAHHTGFNGSITWDSTRPDGQPRRALDISKAQSLFGFTAGIQLEDGLRETIAWWQDDS